MAGPRSLVVFPLIAVVAALTLMSPHVPSAFAASGDYDLSGTDKRDIIVVGPEDSGVLVGTSDDLLIGGAGNNTYHVDAGVGHITIIEVAGQNVVEFGPGLTFSDVASGLWQSGDDLQLVLGNEDRTLTVSQFFAVKNTISSFRFQDGQQLTANQLFQVFGQPAPTEEAPPLQLGTTSNGNSVLEGSSNADILVPSDATQRVRGLGGNDYLIGRNDPVIFDIYPETGRDLIIASSGHHEVLFRDGIQFNDVATQLQKRGDDLVLGNRTNNDEVRIYKFFSLSNTVVNIRFESGGQIQESQLYELFGVAEPTTEVHYALNVEGIVLDPGSGDSDDPGDGSGGDCIEDCPGDGDGSGGGDPGGDGDQLPEDLHWLIGSNDDDLIYVGEGDNLIIPMEGDDYIVGGPGSNLYFFEAGFGNNVIVDSEGFNVIEFEENISYSDVSQSLVKSGDDLLLRVDSKQLRITIRDFFTVKNTIAELRFHDGASLTSTTLFQVFGGSEPTQSRASNSLLMGRGDSDTLSGSDNSEFLVPRMGVHTVQVGKGNDHLIGRLPGGRTNPDSYEGITFELRPGDGLKTLVADSAFTNIRFTGGIVRQDISSNMFRRGDDLFLRSEAHNVGLHIINFFSKHDLIGNLYFAEGDSTQDSLSGNSILSSFGAYTGSESSFNILIKGASTDTCQTSGLDNTEGFGLTPAQLAETNQVPAITSTPGSEAWFASQYVYQVRAADAENDDLCFQVTGPEGVEIDKYSGLLKWQPEHHHIGNNYFELRVVDERGGETLQMFHLTVQDPNREPAFTSWPLRDVVVGQEYFYTLSASDPFVEDSRLTYTLISGPEGMVVDQGGLHWTPSASQIGQQEVVIKVIDPYGLSDIQRFMVNVSPLVTTDRLPEGQSRIPKTGARVTLYDQDDGALRIGTDRFFIRDDDLEVVFDQINGLVWQDNSDVVDDELKDFNQAHNYCSNLSHGGIDEWRLPNRLELIYLMEHNNRSIEETFKFIPGYSRSGQWYFAETQLQGRPRKRGFSAWQIMINFNNTTILPSDYSMSARVRCVSGEQRFLPLLLRIDIHDIVVDRKNRLMWQDTPDLKEVSQSFEGSVGYCDNLSHAGFSDWRLPNFNESQLLAREFEYFVFDGFGWGSKYFQNVPDHRVWWSSTLTWADPGSGYRFKYQYDPESDYTGSWATNYTHMTSGLDGSIPLRCIRSYAEPTPMAANEIPEIVDAGHPVIFDGSESHHIDGEIVAYKWMNLTTGEVLGETAITEWSFSESGSYEIQLTVTDQLGLTQSLAEPIQITVYGPPQIEISGAIHLWAGDSVVLDASDTSDATGISSLVWTNTADGAVIATGPILEVADADPGQHTYRLTATNGRDYSAVQDVQVTVLARPDIEVGGSTSVLVGDSVTLDAGPHASDPSVESIQWLSAETGEVLSEGPTLVLDDLPFGEHQVVLSLTYANGLIHHETVDVQVSGHSPVIETEGDLVAAVGDIVNLNASNSHVPYGDVAAFRWFEGDSEVPFSESAAVDLSDLEPGTKSYRLEVESSAGLISSKTLTVQIGYAPVARLPETYYTYENLPVSLDGAGSSVEDGVLSYEWILQEELVSQEPVAELAGLPVGEYQLQLTVMTELGLSDTAELTLIVEPSRELSTCPVQTVADDSYVDLGYPEQDVEWRGNQAETVDDIERAFNFARSQDPSVFQYLVMPEQNTWDAMSLQEKGLYIVNAERTARGLKPYEGVAPEIVSVAQEYAEFIQQGNQVIGHYNDGFSPSGRLDVNDYIAVNRDAHVKNESIASGIGHVEEVTATRALVEAIYSWVYQDKNWFEDFDWATGPAWGHRDHVLQTGLDENSGIESKEGLIGFGVSRGLYLPGQVSPDKYGYVTVFHTVDPSDQWALETTTSTDISEAQGCNTAHVLDIDEAQIDSNGLTEIRVSPATLMMVPGESLSMSVTGVYDNGNQVDFTPYASFVADRRSIVSVNGGSITAEQQGQAQVFARVDGLESNRLFVRVRKATDITNLEGTSAEAYSEYVPDNASIDEYDPKAMAVYSGVVQDREGQPLAGVQVSFLNQPGLGSMQTDNNGRFIIAGPAGLQTIVYEKTGYLVVQRSSIGASDTWSNLDDVMLLPRDTKQTLIDVTSGDTQVHQSTLISDEYGKRQATVVFNDITSATVLSADGSTRALDEFLLSATEFETPASMPGELPTETAFTFATDLHVAGVHYSDSVVFNNDVVMFVDNFLGFEVGEIVPIGYFDRLGNEWVASSNGVVVQALDQSGDGTIDGVDYTGDGVADDLNGNGSTEDDALGLDGYEPGDTLWWGSFNHFTPVDYNWASSEDEAPTELDTDLDQEDERNDELECTGSYVKPYQQAFHEDISIASTDLTLHYSSQRTDGYKHKARIKVSGDTVPSTLEKMIVKLEVAGRVFERELAPAANTEVEFIWDGTRVDGVRPEGMVSGRVSIGYVYPALYLSSGNAAEEDRELSEFPVAWATRGDSVTQVPGRENYTSWQRRGVSFKNSFDRQLANGWSLSNVHEFDPAGQVYLGNGGVVDVETQSLILKTGVTYSLVEGDDGFYQSGGSNIDYTVNDQGVLVDKVTGLEWQFVEQPYETRTKEDAREYCETEVGPGSGWRLPTSKEVGYTIEKSGANAGPDIYSLTQAKNLWRQSSANPDENLKPVMCVRGETIDDRFVEGLKRDDEQQVVVDQENGLMWQDSSENTSVKLDWESSIQHCEASSFAGFNDWRLPNVNELLYVLPNDVFQHETKLVFPDGEYWRYDASFRKPYWSSTTNFRDDNQAWAVESASFNSERFSKADQYNVRCVREASSASRMPYRFDNEGRHIATIDLNTGATLVEFAYNENGKLNEISDQFGNIIAIERNAEGKPLRIVAPEGQGTELTINNQNDLAGLSYEDDSDYQFFYATGGLLTEKIDPNGNSFPHEFDENGRVYQTRDPEGGQWDFFDNRLGIGHNEYGYTTAEGVQYKTERQVLENGDIRKEITYKDGTSLVEVLTADLLQQTTTYGGVTTVVDKVIDPKTLREVPNVVTVTQPSGLSSTTTITKTYGQNGADTTRYQITNDVNGNTSTTEVDARAGTMTKTSAEGRVIAEVIDPETQLTQGVSVAGMLDTVFEYDEQGRLVEQTQGERNTSYRYDSEGRGQVTAIISADGKETLYEYDQLGRVTKVTHPDGKATVTEYDENGNRTTLVVPTPADHDSTFNGIDRVTSETTPMDEATHYEYDRDRQLTAVELPSGQRLEHTHDENRLVRTDTPEGAILYSYHHGDQLSQVSEGGETISYTWDGSLIKETLYQGELNESIQYEHNPDFRVSQIAYAGEVAALSYDGDGLLSGIHGFTIDRHVDHGLPVNLTNGILNKRFAYNGYGEVASVSTELNQTEVFEYELAYDRVGQIVGKTETLPDGTVNQYVYEYDDRYRLTEVFKNSQLVEQYNYDANGNRTLATSAERGVSGVSASYNLGDQLKSMGAASYTYDGNGRLNQKVDGTHVTTYDYDSQGRLKKVQTPSHTIEYRHNALGNRVAKVKDGEVVERYLWRDKTTLLATYEGNGNLKQRFKNTLGHAPTSFTENGETYYLLTDQLGSPRVITDSAGQVVKTIEYDSYGNVISSTNPDLTIPFGFAGGLKDPDTGLIRFGYRDYDPQAGRWTARDPIGFSGGDTNLYGYVHTNPINFVDALGLSADTPWPYRIDPNVHPIRNIPKMFAQYVLQAWVPSRETASTVADTYAVGALVPICTIPCSAVSLTATGYVAIVDYNSGDENKAAITLIPAGASFATDALLKKSGIFSDLFSNASGIGAGFYTQYWTTRDYYGSEEDGALQCRW